MLDCTQTFPAQFMDPGYHECRVVMPEITRCFWLYKDGSVCGTYVFWLTVKTTNYCVRIVDGSISDEETGEVYPIEIDEEHIATAKDDLSSSGRVLNVRWHAERCEDV